MKKLLVSLALALFASASLAATSVTPAGSPFATSGTGFVGSGTVLPGTCNVTDLFFKTDATPGQNIYMCTASNTWTQQLNSGAGGASTALDNLASSNINTSLLPQTGVDLGSTAKQFRTLYLWGAGTFGTNYFTITGTPTAPRTITLPNLTGTLATLDGAQTFTNKNITGAQISSAVALATDTVAKSGNTSTYVTYAGAATPGRCLEYDASGNASAAAAACGTGGGGGTPAGSSGDIQTNNAGSFGAFTPGSNCVTWLTTPSSANLRACLTDEVGTGAFYTVGGALGTPASGTVTNLTGTASININGTVGATTPAAGLFSTLGAATSLNVPHSTSLPGTCTVGDIYSDTDATTRGRLNLCESTNTWAVVGPASGGGSGDVVGPASAVDGNVVLFDTTTGKLIKDSGSTLVIAGTMTDTRLCIYTASGTQVVCDTATSTFQTADSDLTSWAGVTRASGFDTFAATPSGANFAALLTSAVPVTDGGTGAATLTGIIKGNGTSAFTAAVLSDVLGFYTGTPNGAKFLRDDGSWQTPGGSGTVTATGGSLTANAVVLGAGTTDTKVVAGITTNGTAQLVLGVNTTTLGSIKLFGNTSGDVTISSLAIAGTATAWLVPATSDTFVGLVATQSLSNKTLTAPVLSGSLTGTYTLAGTPTITSPAISGPTFSGTLAGTYTIGGTPTFPSSVVQLTSTQTVTNKRVTPRVVTTASSGTPAINTDDTDVFTITALAAAITSMTSSLTGTPTEGQILKIWIKDNGTARAIAWGASFQASSDLALPTTTTLGKYLYTSFMWNATASKWFLTGKLDNF